MNSTFDFSILPTNLVEYKIFYTEYNKLDEISQITIERLYNPIYNRDIIQTDKHISIICLMLKLEQIEYKDLPHKFKINPLIIDQFIKTLVNIREKIYQFPDIDLIFSPKYLPIILLYNKDFIIKLLQVKICNTFYNYKNNHPNSFLLNDFDINKNALKHFCYETDCNQYNILEDINQTFYTELFDYFLEQNPEYIRCILEFDLDITDEQINICLTNCPSLHSFILDNFETDDKYTTIEYIFNLLDKNINLENIYIPTHIQTPEIYIKAVKKNGLNIKDVPEEFINEELVNMALNNTQLALLVIPIEYIKDKNLNIILDITDCEELSKLQILNYIHKRESYFSEENLLIIKGLHYHNHDWIQKITNLLSTDRNFLIKYIKYRKYFPEILNIQSVITDYEILSNMNIDEYIHIRYLDKIAYLKYLIDIKNYRQINELLPYIYININQYTIEMMHTLVKIDKNYIIYFDHKYLDGRILNNYDKYKIINSKNYMLFLIYIRSKLIDLTFINKIVLSFLTNNYKY